MSATLLGAAMKAKLGSRTRKLVLIKLVDCCREDGTHIYPALATVAEDAECSLSTARRTLKEFCAVGLLRKVRDGGAGARSTAHYEMDVELLLLLRRADTWPALEAAAVQQPLDESEDADEPGHAPDASEEASSCENKGVTVEGFHGGRLPNGDLRVSPDDTQPLSRTLRRSERESAGASFSENQSGEGTAAGLGEASSETPAGQGEEPVPGTLAEFRVAYPHAGADDQGQLASAWEALPFAERRAAIDGVPGFLAERKAAGFASRLSAPKYLAGGNWRHVPRQVAERAAAAQGQAVQPVAAWSRDWWLVVIDKLKAGQGASFWVQQAEAGKAMSARAADLAAASARVGPLEPYRCDGPEIEAWRSWMGKRGARIPPFSGSFRVFLPSPYPPGGRRDDGDDDVAL